MTRHVVDVANGDQGYLQAVLSELGQATVCGAETIAVPGRNHASPHAWAPPAACYPFPIRKMNAALTFRPAGWLRSRRTLRLP